MAKYNWDKRLLQRYLFDPVISEDLGLAFEFLDNPRKFDEPKMSFQRVLASDCHFFDYNPFLEKAYSTIINENTTATFIPTASYKTIIPVDRAIFLTNAFYRETSPSIYKAFLANYSKRFTHLMESTPKLFRSIGDYSGHCFCSETARDCLIQFWATRDIDMLTVLIHEYAHAMAFTLRDYHYTLDQNVVFSEVESIFMELIAALWIKKNTGYAKEIHNEVIKIHNEILNIARISLETYDLCSMTMDMHFQGKSINFNSVVTQAKSEFGDMDKDYIAKLLKSPIDMLTPYGYSGLIAVELYLIYLQSPNDAFDLLERIVCANGENPIKMSYTIKQLGITPGLNFDNFSRSLKK